MTNDASAAKCNYTMPGQIGPYPIVRRLAAGGMAEVFLARSQRPGPQLVALKRVHPEHAQKSHFVRMFRDEVRILAGLAHPNIAQLYDFSMTETAPYYTMELVKGLTVSRLHKIAHHLSCPIPLSCAVSIVGEAAAALHYAHEKTDVHGAPLGIVHRDVSPSNILLGSRGQVKIIDFGVAKGAQREFQTTRRLLKGRIGYMSPEQCLGAPIDRRSDIFALGILLYELTTGKKAFGGSDYQILSRTAGCDIAPPSRFKPAYPKELEVIVLRALRRKTDERYQTAEQFLAALRTFSRAQGLHVSAASRREFLADLIRRRAPRRRRSHAETVRIEKLDLASPRKGR